MGLSQSLPTCQQTVYQITRIDRRGKNYDPSKWFVVPLNVINQAISMIMSGGIIDYVYDSQQEKLVPRELEGEL